MAIRSISPVKLKIYSIRLRNGELWLLASLAAIHQIREIYSMPKIVTENISKMKKAVPYLVPRELTDSIATATKFSNINVDRNQSQTRLARSFPLDRVRI